MFAARSSAQPSELLVRKSSRTSTALSTLMLKFQGWTFLISSFTSRSATRASRNFLTILFPHFCSDFILCLGVIQCFVDYHRIIPILWLKSTLTHSDGLPTITSIPFWTVTLSKETEARWLVVLSWRTFSCRGPSFPINSVVESWTVANPYLFLWILASSLECVSFNSYLLGSIDILLPIVRTLHCFFFLCPWLQQGQRRALQVVFNEKRNVSYEFFALCRTTIVYVWCSLTIHLFEQHLECAETAMGSGRGF